MSTYDLLGPGTANDEEDAMDADMDPTAATQGGDDDGEQQEEEDEEEEEGNVDLMGDNTGDEDSSEEGTEGSEEEREVRAGFIVDEDESSSRKKKKRKHKREDGDRSSRKRRNDSDEEGDLDEDDLALLEENTGLKLGARSKGSSSGKLKRLRRHRSASAESEASAQGLNNLFDDGDVAPVDRPELFDDDEMAGFIEDDTQSDSSGRHGSDGSEDEDDRTARRNKKKQEKKKQKAKPRTARRSGFSAGMVDGISAETWNDVTDVFGNGQDYSFALEEQEDMHEDKELKDIFEPSEIASRMLTAADDAIRQLDIPERMQLASAGIPTLPLDSNDAPAPFIDPLDLDEATSWMQSRISSRCNEEFLLKDVDGEDSKLEPLFLEAVKNAIKFINLEFLEVPFLLHHRSDFFVHYDPEEANPDDRTTVFLDQTELWRISALSVKFRAFANRKQELRKTFEALDLPVTEEVDYFENLLVAVETVEEVADLTEWVAMKYERQLKEAKADEERERSDGKVRYKRAGRDSIYQDIKKSRVSNLANQMAMTATELSLDFVSASKTHFFEDPKEQDSTTSIMPDKLASLFISGNELPEAVLERAKMIHEHEISRDPMIKRETRRYFKEYGVVSVSPTEKGISKIDQMNPYYAFKYLEAKPISGFLRSPQFLQILAAETEGLVTTTIFLPPLAYNKLLSELKKLYLSDFTSSVAEAWNNLRVEILEAALKNHLLPAAASWARNMLKEEEEEFVGRNCFLKLESRINVAPFCRSDSTMEKGEVPSVLAITHGQGNPSQDSVICVFLDSEGHFREHLKIDNLGPDSSRQDPDQRQAFLDLLRNRRPQVIVVGGFSAATKRLMSEVKSIAQEVSQAIIESGEDQDDDEDLLASEREARAAFETTFVYDDVARIYQNSRRAVAEFPELSQLGKYCVGLARYAQSPLNEYAALGSDLAAITFDPYQKLLDNEKALLYLERALIAVTNSVGVDINKAIRNPYYYHLLPFVSGLGPRKASSLVKKINGPIGGTLTSRANLVLTKVMTKNIFMNASAFLRIPQDDLNADLKRNSDDGDVLDDTRIHPEDYDVARKMAADAMEYDEEDIGHLKNASQACVDVMADETSAKKLDDLSLDDFASELAKILHVPKRLTLYRIREEMQNPYIETRNAFMSPSYGEIFTMLTGETQKTLDRGLIIPVRVIRVRQDDTILVRLDSGIEGTISKGYRADLEGNQPAPKPGQTIQALVIELTHETFEVELSSQEAAIANGDSEHRQTPTDPYFNRNEAAQVEESRVATRARGGRTRRIINHPNFQNASAGEAELFLTHQPRGDCVIRPSSKEDHLTVTWKVDEGVYQHIAVMEMNKANEFAIGSKLVIDKYVYTDLDELIDMHVKQMSRKVDLMMAHEKYKGSQETLTLFLQNYTMANPGQSAYGFGLNRSDPKLAGEFVVCFRANQNTEVQSWPVKVVPGAFQLFNEEHGDVTALCNAFKTVYLSRATDKSGRLPGRTPAHNPSGRTPNPYLQGRTPNPYGQSPARGGHGRTPLAGRATPLALSGRATPLVRSGLGNASPYPGGAPLSQQPIPQGGYSAPAPQYPPQYPPQAQYPSQPYPTGQYNGQSQQQGNGQGRSGGY